MGKKESVDRGGGHIGRFYGSKLKTETQKPSKYFKQIPQKLSL